MKLPELLLPAGSLSKLAIAYEYGADAAYVGAAGFSMRPDGASFTPDQLLAAVDIAKTAGRKLYVAVNSLIFESELEELTQWLTETRETAFDAIIVADCGAAAMVRRHRPDVELHISTQMSTANSQAVNFWAAAGANRVILARECTLQHAAHIVRHARTDVEIFVHGAMCVAVAGRCLLSAHLAGRSGSRGDCKHACRCDWQLVEAKRPGETLPIFEAGGQSFLLGSNDLCLIEHIPQIVATGVKSLKIEGRMKGEYYVAVVADVYRQALDEYAKLGEAWQCRPQWLTELESVTHQPYSTGFAFGYPTERPHSLQSGGRVPGTHDIAAIIEKNCDGGVFLADAKRPFSAGDELEWLGRGCRRKSVTVKTVFTLDGQPVTRTHVGVKYLVTFDSQFDDVPKNSILRKLAVVSSPENC